MLGWALTFFVFGVIAGVLGFGGIPGAATHLAQVLFAVCVVLFALSLLVTALKGRRV